jgi:hypothetical protein
LKSVVVAGRDYADSPFAVLGDANKAEIAVTVTRSVPVLAGIVQDDRGKGVPNAAVIAFPRDRAMWINFGLSPTRIKTAIAGRDGTFQLRSLPAGDYLVVAADGNDVNAWQDPDFFNTVETLATSVRLGWGQSQSVVLRQLRRR